MSEEQLPAPRSAGVVKWFNGKKGFGFISPGDGGDDVFVHQSSIQVEGFRSLAEGAQVEYTPVDGADGRMKAIEVTGPGGSRPKVGMRTALHPQHRAQRYSVQQPVMSYAAPYPYNLGGYPQYGYGLPYPGQWTGGYTPDGMPAYAPPAPAGAPPYHPYMPGGMPGHMGASVMPVPGAMGGGGIGGPRGRPFKVVVHNVAWSTTSEELEAAFVRWDPQRAEIITDSNGQSRGYGVVTFPTQQDMDTAMNEMHGSDLGGRRISVRPDRFI